MPNPNQRRGSQFVRLLFLLFAGAAASVLIAWSIELVRAHQDAKHWPPPYGTRADIIFRISDPENPNASLTCFGWTTFGRQEWKSSRLDFPTDKSPSRRPPYWSLFPAPDARDSNESVAYGLPWLCLKYDISHATGIFREQFAIRLSSDSNILYSAGLPLIPLWRGLIANTLTYAALFAVIATSLRQTRRHLRLRRGHCPACNYELLANYNHPCPECGRTSPLHGTLPRSSPV